MTKAHRTRVRGGPGRRHGDERHTHSGRKVPHKAHPIEIAKRMRCTDCGRKSLTETVRVR